MSQKTLARTAALGGYFSLILILILWYGVFHPAPWTWVFIPLPLLLPLYGLLKGKPYTYAWSSFLIMLYFIHGIMEAWANEPVRLWASLEVIASVVMYSGAILYARIAGREQKQQQ